MVPTVRVVAPVSDDNPLGYIVINEEDFDAASMVLFVEPDAAPPAPPAKGKAKD